MSEHWYGLVVGHRHPTVDEMWSCRGCRKQIAKRYPFLKD